MTSEENEPEWMKQMIRVAEEGLTKSECLELGTLIQKYPARFLTVTRGKRFQGTARAVGTELLRIAKQCARGGDA
jgi:hypothetical protein